MRTVSWIEPTTNEDGSALTDLSHYLVRWRKVDSPAWASKVVRAARPDPQSGSRVGTRIRLGRGRWVVRVYAVDRAGGMSKHIEREVRVG